MGEPGHVAVPNKRDDMTIEFEKKMSKGRGQGL